MKFPKDTLTAYLSAVGYHTELDGNSTASAVQHFAFDLSEHCDMTKHAVLDALNFPQQFTAGALRRISSVTEGAPVSEEPQEQTDVAASPEAALVEEEPTEAPSAEAATAQTSEEPAEEPPEEPTAEEPFKGPSAPDEEPAVENDAPVDEEPVDEQDSEE